MTTTHTPVTRALKDIKAIEKCLKEIKKHQKLLKQAKALHDAGASDAAWYADKADRIKTIISLNAFTLIEACSAIGAGDDDDWSNLGYDIATHLTK